MATSVVFDLVTQLVSRFGTALTTVSVYDGYGETDEGARDFLMVGVEDPDQEGRAPSVDAQQSWAGLGKNSRDEVGTVTCVAVSWNGDVNGLAAARASVKATLAALENLLRGDPNLSGAVPGLLWTGFGTRLQLNQLQASDGTSVICVFEVAFKARI